MIKENVLRKNLLNGDIDSGNVDPIFEAINLPAQSSGNLDEVVVASPWIEVTSNSSDYQDYNKSVKLRDAKRLKSSQVEEAYSLAQFAFIRYNGNTFKVSLRGEDYDQFVTQVSKGVISGVSMLATVDTSQKLVILEDLPYTTVLKPIFDRINPISEGNLILKRQFLYRINSITEDLVDANGQVIKTALECLNEIVINFIPIKTFSI